MKKIALILSILLLSIHTMEAQNMKRERIKSLKISYLTNALELTPDEAEKFWPVYNLYTTKIRKLKYTIEKGIHKEIEAAGGIENLSEKQAQTFIDKTVKLEREIAEAKIDMSQKLSKIISAKKMILLKKADRDFGKKMLHEYGRRKKIKPQ